MPSIVSAIDLESPLQTPVLCIAVSMIFSIKDKIMVAFPRAVHIAQMTRAEMAALPADGAGRWF
jgi:hypothetical protein